MDALNVSYSVNKYKQLTWPMALNWKFFLNTNEKKLWWQKAEQGTVDWQYDLTWYTGRSDGNLQVIHLSNIQKFSGRRKMDFSQLYSESISRTART